MESSMLGEVNFHSRPQWHVWAQYTVLTGSLIVAITVAASV
jgi:hypothetical protein